MNKRWITILMASSALAACSSAPGGGSAEGDPHGVTSQASQAITGDSNVLPAVGTAPAAPSRPGAAQGNALPGALPGSVLANPRIVSVLWGPGVYVGGFLGEYYSDLVSGPYLPALGSYGVSNGSYAGQVQISPSNPTTSLSLAILQSELSNDASNGTLPGWDSNTVYVVHLPDGFTVTDQNGSIQCAYHSTFSFNGTTSAFAVVGSYAPGNTCSNGFVYTLFGSQATDTLFATSHEVIEAAVDPYFQGNPEVGDPCDNTSNNGGIAWTSFLGTNHSWIVQKPWIQSSSSCTDLPIPAPITPSAANSDAFAVARLPGNLDAFFAEGDGTVVNDWWNGQWGSTPTTSPNSAAPGAPIAATARTGNNLDVFWFGTDGGLYTAYWSGGNPWNAFRITGTGAGPSAANLAAVARTGNNLDVFWFGNDGGLFTAYWSPAAGWNSFEITGSNVAPPGAPLAAVARTQNNIDVFYIDSNGALQTAYWSPPNGWNSFEISGWGIAGAGTPIAAATREWLSIDVFWVDGSGNVQQATWADGENNANWRIRGVPPAVAYGGAASLSAVTRQPGNLDLFLVGTDGAVYNPFYSDLGGGWGQTKTTGDGQSVSGSPIAGTTRTPSNLDGFETDGNGNRFNTFWSAGNPWGTVQIP